MFNRPISAMLDLARRSRYSLEGFTYRFFCDSSKLRRLRGSQKNKTVLIVGNGPSLNETPLKDFSGVFSIGMNKIDLIFDKTSWRPDVILSTNRHVIAQQSVQYSKSIIPIFIPWQQRWFLNPRGSLVNYFNQRGHRKFSVDFEEGVGLGHTVTSIALQFAYYLQASKIILVIVN